MERQFVVQLDNRPGELAHLARALGRARRQHHPHLVRRHRARSPAPS